MTHRLRRARSGFTLVDLILTLAIAALLALLTVPPLLQAAGWLRVRLAAMEVVAVMRAARQYAARNAANVGLKFRIAAGSAVSWALYADGDGDGVRTDDIDAGTDPAVTPPQRLDLGRIRFGFPPGRAPRDPGDPTRRLTNLDDPVRFNRSDIAAFSPIGEATPGSVYLTDGLARLAVVRVYGRTAKVKLLFYDPLAEVWH